MHVITTPIFSVAGEHGPQPGKIEVKIVDGEVKLHWKSPVDAPSNSEFNVYMGM